MTRDELEAMTKDELVAYADDRDIEVNHGWLKGDIVSAILKEERAVAKYEAHDVQKYGAEQHDAVTPSAILPAAFDQYYPGGVFKQISDGDAQGPGTTYNQYAAGGVWEQLRLICGAPTLNQYALGGIHAQLAAGAA